MKPPVRCRQGLSCINQSVKAFVYCTLGTQVNVHSSVLGEGGRAKEAHNKFLVSLEDAIKQPALIASVQRYQLAVDEVKVRLNLTVPWCRANACENNFNKKKQSGIQQQAPRGGSRNETAAQQSSESRQKSWS